MDFYDRYEGTLARRNIVLETETSNMMDNSNYNSVFMLSTLNDFYDRNYVSVAIMDDFNNDIYQRVVYENILEFKDPYARKSYRTFKKEMSMDIPVGYEIAYSCDSIVDSGIYYMGAYIRDKYQLLDIDALETITGQMDQFNLFNYYLKILNILDCFSHIEIEKYFENLQNLLREDNEKSIINTLKDKSHIAVMWNNFLAYLSRGDKDIHQLFLLQGWDFINSFVQSKI